MAHSLFLTGLSSLEAVLKLTETLAPHLVVLEGVLTEEAVTEPELGLELE